MNSSPRVLIVEDLDFWQEALSEVLTEAGYRVGIAPSYAAALEALARHEFHLAVIDPVLDDTNRRNRDGMRVLQYILDERPEMHAVVITSSDPNRIRREIQEMCPGTPLLWKDEWDDKGFLSIVSDLLCVTHRSPLGKRET